MYVQLKILVIVVTFATANTNPLTKWTVSNVTMQVANSGVYNVYSQDSIDPECIFLFGGRPNGFQTSCYNLSSNTYNILSNLTVDVKSPVGQRAVLFAPDNVYFIHRSGILYNLNLTTQNAVIAHALQIIWERSCIVRHPTNSKYFFVVALQSTNFLYIYDISTGNFTTVTSLINNHILGTCVVNSYNNQSINASYLYVFGGESSYIERINLDNVIEIANECDDDILSADFGGVNFEFIPNSDTSTSLGFENDYLYGSSSSGGSSGSSGSGVTYNFSFCKYATGVSYKQWIYIIGCAKGGPTNNIIYLDVVNWVVEYWGNMPNAVRSIASVLSFFLFVFSVFSVFCFRLFSHNWQIILRYFVLFCFVLFCFQLLVVI